MKSIFSILLAAGAVLSTPVAANADANIAFILDDPSKADPLPANMHYAFWSFDDDPLFVKGPPSPSQQSGEAASSGASKPDAIKLNAPALVHPKKKKTDEMWRSAEEFHFTDFFKAH